MKTIDLRSDTVTLPSPEMREAIYKADLGDDVFGEDPTTNQLEQMAAESMGKEAALMVVSGTMANLVCVLSHCRRGEEVILGDRSHTFLYEAGGMSALGGRKSLLTLRPAGGYRGGYPRRQRAFSTHPADLPGKHPQSMLRLGADGRVYGSRGGTGPKARFTGASRRRADIQCGGSFRDRCQGNRPLRGFRGLLLVQGTLGAGRLISVRLQ